MPAAYTYITDTGTIVPDTSSLLSDVQGEWQTAVSPDINTDASTPSGSLMQGETVTRAGVMKNNAEIANLINPDLSYGVYLDAIGSLLGIGRGENSATTASGIVITGDPQTPIPAGSRVKTSNNDVFETTADVTIPPSRTTTVGLQAQSFGPIALPEGPLTIVDGIIGWGSATVPVGTVPRPGALALSDSQFKVRRRQRLAAQGVGSSAAIYAAALGVDGIDSVNVVENNTGAVGVVNGVTFTLPNAMWVCVDGLTATNQQDLIDAIYRAKSGGCPWDFGDESIPCGNPLGAPNGVVSVDPVSKQRYNVKITTAILWDCYVNITVSQGQSASTPTESVQNAIVDYANGQEDGEEGLVIGAPVSAFEMGGAVARNLPGLYVKSVTVAVVATGVLPQPSDFVLERVMRPFDRAVLAAGRVNVQVV